MGTNSSIQIQSIKSATVDGLVGEIVYRGTGDDEADGAEVTEELQSLLGNRADVEWLTGPCNSPTVDALIHATFRASPTLWSTAGTLMPTERICLVIAGPSLGDVDGGEYQRECERLERCYDAECKGLVVTDADGDPKRVAVSVRPCVAREAEGTYYVRIDGTLQILGGSVTEEDISRDLYRLHERAWQRFCSGECT